MSNRPYVSYNLNEAVFEQLKARVEWYAFPQTTTLAVRITSDTPGAMRCPNYDVDRETETVPDDPECLGVGYIVPARGLTPIQRGYLNPVPFDVVLVPGEVREDWSQEGIVQYPDNTVAYWPPRDFDLPNQPLPKKGDVMIVNVKNDPRSYRYVVAGVETPSVLGSQTLFYKALLEPRRADNVVFLIPPADVSGLNPGQWD